MGPLGLLQWTSSATRYLPNSYRISHADLLLYPNDIVMNLTAQSLKDDFLGRVCLVTAVDEALLNQRIARLRAVAVRPEFAVLVFRSPLFRRYVRSLNSGSLIQHMFTKQVNEFWFPVPPAIRQRELVQEATEYEAGVTRLQDATQSAQRHADALRRSLLDAAFSGRLRDSAMEMEMEGV
jgi:type I restriction enzyme S subunit